MSPIDNIFVFPCGSEVGLEIYESLKYEKTLNLFGGSSVDDHGRYIFENYIGNLPLLNEEEFLDAIKQLIACHDIRFIFPTMDIAALFFSKYRRELNADVISSSYETNQICYSKKKTYELLRDKIPTPKIYDFNILNDSTYPVFLKPDNGYGSRGTVRADEVDDLKYYIQKRNDLLILEYLPGKEYTIDCFTDFKGQLCYCFARERCRIRNGISVNSKPVTDNRFYEYAKLINENILFDGVWFFQMKERSSGELVLMEVSTRTAGTMGLNRIRGVNLPLLSVWNARKTEVSFLTNTIYAEIDRALCNKFFVDHEFENVYVDLDDTIIVHDKINTDLMAFLYDCINHGKKVILLTRHKGDLDVLLAAYRIGPIFDQIVQMDDYEPKSKYITSEKSIFIDDSFRECQDIARKCRIPVYPTGFHGGMKL
jgi:hypothetical protein